MMEAEERLIGLILILICITGQSRCVLFRYEIRVFLGVFGRLQGVNRIDVYGKLVNFVQWYPGHIAKTEKELKEQLKLMDVVIEVRDARIPLSTTHPLVKFMMN